MGRPQRYVIYGAGAVGGTLAASLHRSGHEVVVIARGRTREVVESDGLKLMTQAGTYVARPSVAGHPGELSLTPDDVVMLAMKTQDTLAAVQALTACAPPGLAVFCAQNGVENERIAQRFLDNVYGMFVFVVAATLVPGEVQCHTAPSLGVIDLGRYTSGGCGDDERAQSVAADLTQAGIDSLVRERIMDWKYAKLLLNLGNALTASYGDSSAVPDLYEAAQEEGRQCLWAAGIPFVSLQDIAARKQHLLPLQLVGGKPFPGSSSWQSLARGGLQTEVDYLCGEIVLLGRQYGVPTPLNAALQQQVRTMALNGTRPGSLDPSKFRRLYLGAGTE